MYRQLFQFQSLPKQLQPKFQQLQQEFQQAAKPPPAAVNPPATTTTTIPAAAWQLAAAEISVSTEEAKDKAAFSAT